jgi:hypothetical protein
MGENDPLGARRDGLDVFLDQKVAAGYRIETSEGVQALHERRRPWTLRG